VSERNIDRMIDIGHQRRIAAFTIWVQLTGKTPPSCDDIIFGG